MKKLILILNFTLFGSCLLLSQSSRISWGVSIAPKINRQILKNPVSNATVIQTNNRVKYVFNDFAATINFNIYFKWTKKHTIQSGLGIHYFKSYINEIFYPACPPAIPITVAIYPLISGSETTRAHNNYLSLPFYHRFKLAGKKNFLYSLAGLDMMFRAESIIINDFNNCVRNAHSDFASEYFRPAVFLLKGSGGLGYEWETKKGLKVFIEGFFDYNLSPLFEGESLEEWGLVRNNDKLRGLGLSFGVRH